MSWETPELGPCCACEECGPTVRTVMMLHKKSPIQGRGWGCLACHLTNDGALAVLCDRCYLEDRPLRFPCRGYAGVDGRIPILELQGVHDHDLSYHPEVTMMRERLALLELNGKNGD